MNCDRGIASGIPCEDDRVRRRPAPRHSNKRAPPTLVIGRLYFGSILCILLFSKRKKRKHQSAFRELFNSDFEHSVNGLFCFFSPLSRRPACPAARSATFEPPLTVLSLFPLCLVTVCVLCVCLCVSIE